jgi:hypothetical protein
MTIVKQGKENGGKIIPNTFGQMPRKSIQNLPNKDLDINYKELSKERSRMQKRPAAAINACRASIQSL